MSDVAQSLFVVGIALMSMGATSVWMMSHPKATLGERIFASLGFILLFVGIYIFVSGVMS